MSDVSKVYELTKQMYSILSETISPQNRDDVIKNINLLIDQREVLIKQISPPYTDMEKQLAEKIIKLDVIITEKMENLFINIKQDIKTVKKNKALNRSYINPYGTIQTTDGMFLDSKQ